MNETHNVFICWSGERSRVVAEFLRSWLPKLIQVAKPWMSEVDAEKGSRWFDEISRALEDAKVGICCLTPENLNAPWLLFEAGALSKSIEDSTRLCTYLLGGVRREHVAQPLGMFQGTRSNKEDTRKLVHAINHALSDPVPKENLNEIFVAMWPQLEATLANLPQPRETVRTERSIEDMVAEILEIIRAERRGKKTESARKAAPDESTLDPRLAAIKALLFDTQSKFLSSCLNALAAWRFEDGEVHFIFPSDAAWAVDLIKLGQGQHQEKLISACGEVLGQPVRIHIELLREDRKGRF